MGRKRDGGKSSHPVMHLRGNDRGVAEIHKGQVAEEIVHGSVKVGI